MSDKHEQDGTNEHHEHGPKHEEAKEPAYGLLIGALCLILVLFGFLLFQGIPQDWTETALGHGQHEHVEEAHAVPAAQTAPDGTKVEKSHPHYFMILPFALLLGAIAVFPLCKATEHWWESNLHRFYVAGGLGVLTLLYYGFLYPHPIELHWPGHAIIEPGSGPIVLMWTIFKNAIVGEFIPFIVLLFALYSIAGGIRIQGDLKASPLTNSVILLIGATLASVVGTTGAAMLLIRLLLETNKERKYKVHTVVFFIFCVCNCGGCLLPIGDPPLFLGYLRGVAFLWTTCLWKEWAFVNGILIVLFFLLDTVWFYPRESQEDKQRDNTERTPLVIRGWKLNIPLLLGVVLAVMYLAPEKNFFEGIGVKQLCAAMGKADLVWNPPYFLREVIQLLLVTLSVAAGSRLIRRENGFNFNAIIEVAALFFGIFLCMQAPLGILNAKGDQLPLKKPIHYFWATGTLSSVLDNAPTYVVFFEAAKAQQAAHEERAAAGDAAEIAKQEKDRVVPVSGGRINWHLLVAVSLGAVFMGSMTYIGNGPNFMVKAIAEESGVKMPSFGGYMVYSFIILLPILALMNYLFLRV